MAQTINRKSFKIVQHPPCISQGTTSKCWKFSPYVKTKCQRVLQWLIKGRFIFLRHIRKPIGKSSSAETGTIMQIKRFMDIAYGWGRRDHFSDPGRTRAMGTSHKYWFSKRH